MEDIDQILNKVTGLPVWLVQFLEKWVKKLPKVKTEIEKQTESMIRRLKPSVKPYEGKFNSYSILPLNGLDQEEILSEIKKITE
ncbi:uncharacterized protein METZ01_LOCUS424510, partial [marine metagenome]